MGRLKPGVTLAQAQADMTSVEAAMARQYPADERDNGVEVIPLRRDLPGPTGPVLLLLLGAVSFVLLIACANVANLLLARSLARRGEATVRLALGANRLALVQPFVLESVLLSRLGGALALGLAASGSRLLAGLAPARVLDPASLRANGAVPLFTCGVALAVGLLCRLCSGPAPLAAGPANGPLGEWPRHDGRPAGDAAPDRRGGGRRLRAAGGSGPAAAQRLAAGAGGPWL